MFVEGMRELGSRITGFPREHRLLSKSRTLRWLAGVVIAPLPAIGCAPQTPQEIQPPKEIMVVVTATPTVTPEITSTPIPRIEPTNTPEPTSTPELPRFLRETPVYGVISTFIISDEMTRGPEPRFTILPLEGNWRKNAFGPRPKSNAGPNIKTIQ